MPRFARILTCLTARVQVYNVAETQTTGSASANITRLISVPLKPNTARQCNRIVLGKSTRQKAVKAHRLSLNVGFCTSSTCGGAAGEAFCGLLCETAGGREFRRAGGGSTRRRAGWGSEWGFAMKLFICQIGGEPVGQSWQRFRKLLLQILAIGGLKQRQQQLSQRSPVAGVLIFEVSSDNLSAATVLQYLPNEDFRVHPRRWTIGPRRPAG